MSGGADVTLRGVTVAEAYLRLLKLRGLEWFFANAGTDFAPLIEAFAKGQREGTDLPRPVTAPHENVAVSMAMGHTLVSHRPQAVMVHVNVGTANALCGLMNASRLQVPMLFTAGRTPVLEEGAKGARAGFIHWPQEMYDQGGMLREMVRWDYELRDRRQLVTIVDRALSLSLSSPSGPVYLTLPREVLAETLDEVTLPAASRQNPVPPPSPDPASLAEVSEWIAAAERPLIVTSASGRTPEDVSALARLSRDWSIPVVTFNPRFMEIASDHPMNAGGNLSPWLEEADLVLVSETIVPWIPAQIRPAGTARIVQIGADPLFRDLPVRGYAADAVLQGRPSRVFGLLSDALGNPPARLVERAARVAAARPRRSPQPPGDVIRPSDVARLIARHRGDAIFFREGPVSLDDLGLTEPGTFFFAGAAGGLGWSLGAALGASLAKGGAPVICAVGDGSYMFGTPVAAHYVAAEQGVPLLTIVFNNRGWHAVRRSTRGMYRDGHAATASPEPLTDFGPAMNYEHIMGVVGGHGERVERPADLEPAIIRATEAVRSGRQALLNVICSNDG